MGRFLRSLAVCGGVLSVSASCFAGSAARSKDTPMLRLEGPIGDHAVIQRNSPISLSGYAEPNADVSLSFAGREVTVIANDDGRWSTLLDPLGAGGPYTLSVEAGEAMLTIDDILVGNVLLCSGQSNMEYPVYRALNPDREIRAAHSKTVRLLDIPKSIALSPQETFNTPPNWKVASSETVRDFSAVCYFMGRDLHERNGVPLGLIDASWGGSQIEAWLTEETLEADGLHNDALDMLSTYRTNPPAAISRYGQMWEDWWVEETESRPWSDDTDEQSWAPLSGPMRDWNQYDDPSLLGYTGRVWFSRSFDLTEDRATKNAILSLGVVDEKDLTWVNGTLVGATESWSDSRHYDIPADTLKVGSNRITVMADNVYGAGGMMGPDNELALRFSDNDAISLAGDWFYRIAEPAGAAPSPPWSALSGYGTIYNAMVAPLGDYPLAGYVWYQGESNTGRGDQYQPLMKGLVTQSRDQFGAELPFVMVQLPGFGALSDGPAESGWSDVREAQRRVAIDDPLTGLAVTIDAGDRFDIHPANKQIIAKRARDVFLGLLGELEGPTDGISPTNVWRDGSTVSLDFSPIEVRTVSASQPIGFQLCDSSGKCEWAQATLSNNMVDLVGTKFGEPTTVRYCWGDAPICNLFGPNDVPVVPFEVAIP